MTLSLEHDLLPLIHPVEDGAWAAGAILLFEYHCTEEHSSADAELWYRSHSRVEVLGLNPGDSLGMELGERIEEALPFTYRVRFPDGYEGDVWEDELSTSRDCWHRPDPPKRTDGGTSCLP